MKKGILLFFVFFLRKGFYWICLFVTYSFVFNSRGSTLFLLVMSFIVDSVLSEIPTFSLYVGDGGSGEGPSQRPLIDLNSPPAPEPEPALHSLHWELSEGEKRHKRQGKERKIVVRTTKWKRIFGYVKERANSLTCVRRSDYKWSSRDGTASTRSLPRPSGSSPSPSRCSPSSKSKLAIGMKMNRRGSRSRGGWKWRAGET